MKDPYNLTPDQDWCLENTEAEFSGPPSRCAGTLEVKNFSNEKLKLRYLPAVSENQVLKCEQLLCQARLAPQSQQSVEARVKMPKGTPPGRYKVKVPVGSQSFDAQVEVLESGQLSVQPRRVVIEGKAGQVVTKRVSFQNLGNTPILLPGRSMVWLEEKNWAGHNLVQTFRGVESDDTYEAYLNALLKQFKQSMLPAVTLDFDLDPSQPNIDKGLEAMLPPEAMMTRSLTLTLPEGLKKGKTYHGFVKIQRFRFWLAVYCTRSKAG